MQKNFISLELVLAELKILKVDVSKRNATSNRLNFSMKYNKMNFTMNPSKFEALAIMVVDADHAAQCKENFLPVMEEGEEYE